MPAQESVFEAEVYEPEEEGDAPCHTAALAVLPPVSEASVDPDYEPTGEEMDEEFLPSACPRKSPRGDEEPVSQRARCAWSAAEDEQLRAAMAERGETGFRFVAQLMPGRTSKQCRERWFHSVAPNIKKSKLSKHERAIVLEAQREMGNRCGFHP